jgi:hypothetical protein
MCAGVGSMPIKILALQGRSFCATPACKIVTYRQRIVGKQGPGPRVYLRSLWAATGLAAETAAVGGEASEAPGTAVARRIVATATGSFAWPRESSNVGSATVRAGSSGSHREIISRGSLRGRMTLASARRS